MPSKTQPPRDSDPEITKELEHLYAQLAAVEALIRALETYRQYYPRLVAHRSKSA